VRKVVLALVPSKAIDANSRAIDLDHEAGKASLGSYRIKERAVLPPPII
jgi:hypothetical protein